MSEAQHVEYFRKRAATERELAEAAPAQYISRLHLDMAALYDALVSKPDGRNELRVVDDPWGPESRSA